MDPEDFAPRFDFLTVASLAMIVYGVGSLLYSYGHSAGYRQARADEGALERERRLDRLETVLAAESLPLSGHAPEVRLLAPMTEDHCARRPAPGPLVPVC